MTYKWIWPNVGATPIHQGLDSEMFDRTDYPYSETFVREAIQNSLDARLNPEEPVLMKFTFHCEEIGSRRAFLEQVMEYRRRSGLDIPPQWHHGKLRWLVVEDFNTKGLDGKLNSRMSDFWNYWLNFGLSNKNGAGRGGRGIGRVTFLIASRLQSVIGYTRRASDKSSAVCGMAVLRALEDGEDIKSTHAYLARDVSGNIYQLYNSSEFQSRVRDTFRFSGYEGEHHSGLGLAIFYPHEDLKPDGILAAAIENFAPAILDNNLVLDVDGRTLDTATIKEMALQVRESLKDQAIKADVARYLHFIERALTEPCPTLITLPNAKKSDFESLRQFPDIIVQQNKIAEGQEVALDVSFPLIRNGETESVALRAVVGIVAPGQSPIDRLFREGMSLPDVQTKNPGELDLVMLVGEGELATYLNFCEGKAHLDLLESKEVLQKLEKQGFDGPSVKRLIKRLPAELRQLLIPDVREPASDVFESYFSKPSATPGGRRRPTRPDDSPLPELPPRQRVLKIKTLNNGLQICADENFTGWPLNFTATLAYADGTRRPFWSPFDFKLGDLRIESRGCTLEIEDNVVKAKNCGPHTEIAITGFDANRELDTNISNVEKCVDELD